MKAVIQRVTAASVSIEDKVVGEIDRGLLILLGIEAADNQDDIAWLCRKIVKMRIFPDADKPMNRSLLDIDGEALIVSQFTLHARTKKGNRPSFMKAAQPALSKPLYEAFVEAFTTHLGKPVTTGEFGGHMQIDLCNDGPVTILIDSKNPQ